MFDIIHWCDRYQVLYTGVISYLKGALVTGTGILYWYHVGYRAGTIYRILVMCS